jgi:hypothetical protein
LPHDDDHDHDKQHPVLDHVNVDHHLDLNLDADLHHHVDIDANFDQFCNYYDQLG